MSEAELAFVKLFSMLLGFAMGFGVRGMIYDYRRKEETKP